MSTKRRREDLFSERDKGSMRNFLHGSAGFGAGVQIVCRRSYERSDKLRQKWSDCHPVLFQAQFARPQLVQICDSHSNVHKSLFRASILHSCSILLCIVKTVSIMRSINRIQLRQSENFWDDLKISSLLLLLKLKTFASFPCWYCKNKLPDREA